MAKKKSRKKRSRAAGPTKDEKSQDQLLAFADEAVAVAKIARRNRKSLNGVNFYANKMADLRVDATNAFEQLSGKSVGDTSALAELMEKVFSTDAKPKARVEAVRDLQFTIRTTWKDVPEDQSHLEDAGIFPLVTLNQTGRGYLVSVGRQANGAYATGWYDACAVMMRRLLESSIIEAFEGRGMDAKAKDAKSGDFFQLTALIAAALAERSWNLPRNVRKNLNALRDLGHRSSHNRYYLAKKSDIDKHAGVYREAVEAFLHFANLL